MSTIASVGGTSYTPPVNFNKSTSSSNTTSTASNTPASKGGTTAAGSASQGSSSSSSSGTTYVNADGDTVSLSTGAVVTDKDHDGDKGQTSSTTANLNPAAVQLAKTYSAN